MTASELVSCCEKYADLFEIEVYNDLLQYICAQRQLTRATMFSTKMRYVPRV